MLLGALLVGNHVRRALSDRAALIAVQGPKLSDAERDRYEVMLDAELSRYKQVER